ncbi:hypothetical protein CEXT_428991 [Caerostris extrusa]|uniref:Uncharacterized protein n=1 Tax=Caerostris extrusa TaxID=172846 RepID=A0AAV4U4H7_CAEEX|nr:hypothetical protein CEXT_428991 [Caerostris extrusa]
MAHPPNHSPEGTSEKQKPFRLPGDEETKIRRELSAPETGQATGFSPPNRGRFSFLFFFYTLGHKYHSMAFLLRLTHSPTKGLPDVAAVTSSFCRFLSRRAGDDASACSYLISPLPSSL